MKKVLLACFAAGMLAGCDSMVEMELSDYCQSHYEYSAITCDCIAEHAVELTKYVGGDEGVIEISNLIYNVDHGNMLERYQSAALLEVLIGAGYEECK